MLPTALSGFMSTYGLTLHGFITMLALLLYVVASHAFNQRRHPTAAVAWVLFILLVPYVALPAFLMFGSRKQNRPVPALSGADAARADVPWAVQTLLALGQPPPSSYADLDIHDDGDVALAALWRTIDGACESLDVCTFIIGRDPVGQGVLERLAAKARDGVRVRLMVDGMGLLMRRHPSLRTLAASGGEWAVFVPPLKTPLRARVNLRDHRKMVVADAARATRRLWTGGRNLACEYFSSYKGRPAWRDLTFDTGGDLVLQASALFEDDWRYAQRLGSVDPSVTDARRRWSATGVLPPAPFAQVVASGPDEVDDTVHTLLVTAAYRARERILLMTPYFVPDATLLVALCVAVRRGVAIDLVLPHRSNHRMSDIARRRATRTLAMAGGRIWLVPHMLHAKLVVVDETLALAGSANLDSRSLFLNYELMIAFHDPRHVRRFAAWGERERSVAEPYVPKRPGIVTDLAEGLVLWTGFQL